MAVCGGGRKKNSTGVTDLHVPSPDLCAFVENPTLLSLCVKPPVSAMCSTYTHAR